MVAHSAGALERVSSTCHLPATGFGTPANQEYGGPPKRVSEVAATLPFGATSESLPSSGFSAANRTRSGAPRQGEIGDGSTAISLASSQLAARTCWARTSAAEKTTAMS